MRQTKLFFMAFILPALLACAGAEIKNTPSMSGQAAVDFTLPDQNGKMWTLSETLKDYRAVVLAFYPLDDAGA